jgi:lipopolysaccharide biosynthesis glycosyltransferase
MLLQFAAFVVLFIGIRLSVVCASDFKSLRPIHIGLSLDGHSLKDLIILMNSVIESALEPEDIVFHIVACGKDMISAMVLKKSIATSISDCLPHVKHELVAFMLPEESGFSLQLANLKKKSNHWNSQSGADMVRFFLPSLFSHVERILYLDNDVIVSCCLEEIWDTPMKPNQVVGIALDSLNWATVTQFNRHYNASHPLVVKHMRRDQSDADRAAKGSEPISTTEFSKALPRYPNDGVLLIDVKKYNNLHILELMDEIAKANANGEYVVNLGTQQFTVLALYDRWVELTPRANMRHFPDMARGYLMWFYYNGFIHYAGQHKPKLLCQTTTAENAGGRIPYLRVMSYTAWALSNYQTAQRCPADQVAYTAECVAHVHKADTVHALVQLVQRIVGVSRDPSLLYAHVGGVHGDFSQSAYQQWASSSQYAKSSKLQTKKKSVFNESSALLDPLASLPPPKTSDLFENLFRLMLHNSSLSVRGYDFKSSRADQALTLIKESGFPNAMHAIPGSDPSKKGKGKKEKPVRTIVWQTKRLCDNPTSPYREKVDPNGSNSTVGTVVYKSPLRIDVAGTNPVFKVHQLSSSDSSAAAGPALKPCASMLAEIKGEGRAHWDPQIIVIDTNSPQSHPAPTHVSSAASGGGDKTQKHQPEEQHLFGFKHSSLGVLLNLDLIFMRPKIILLRLASVSREKLSKDLYIADRFLRQNGYMSTFFHSMGGGTDDKNKHEKVTGSALLSGKSNLLPHSSDYDQEVRSWCGGPVAIHKSETGTVADTSLKTSGDSMLTVEFACIWGVRVNEFEFFPNLL